MSDERRFVFDANVIVSAALIKEGNARKALDHAQTVGVVLISPSVLAELEDVLARAKFDKYLSVLERKIFLTGLMKTTRFAETRKMTSIYRWPSVERRSVLSVVMKIYSSSIRFGTSRFSPSIDF